MHEAQRLRWRSEPGSRLATAAPAGAGTDGISGSANWSVGVAEPGATVTLAGGYQNGAPGPATYVMQLGIAGGGNGLITSFATSAEPLAGARQLTGSPSRARGTQQPRTRRRPSRPRSSSPSGSTGQEWQGNALWTEHVARHRTSSRSSPRSPTVPAHDDDHDHDHPRRRPSPVRRRRPSRPRRPRPPRAVAGRRRRDRPRRRCRRRGRPPRQLVIAAMATLLAGVMVVLAARRRPLR